ncbi:MAG TPA: hypothetical protein VGM06_24540 [Polyangiaceae bacterium]|jgi:hypothetical protein
MSKRPPEDVLRGIEESASEEALQRVLAMSEGERRRELEAAGVDMRRLRAAATNLYEDLHRGRPGDPPKQRGLSWRPPRERDRRTRWLWAVLAIAVALIGLVWLESHPAPTSAAGPATMPDAGIE